MKEGQNRLVPPHPEDVDQVLKVASHAFCVPLQELAYGRKKEVSEQRQLTMGLLRQELHLSNYEIGRIMRRDKSAVHWGLKRLPGLLKREWQSDFDYAVSVLRGKEPMCTE